VPVNWGGGHILCGKGASNDAASVNDPTNTPEVTSRLNDPLALQYGEGGLAVIAVSDNHTELSAEVCCTRPLGLPEKEQPLTVTHPTPTCPAVEPGILARRE